MIFGFGLKHEAPRQDQDCSLLFLLTSALGALTLASLWMADFQNYFSPPKVITALPPTRWNLSEGYNRGWRVVESWDPQAMCLEGVDEGGEARVQGGTLSGF